MSSRQAKHQSKMRALRVPQGLCADCGGQRPAGTYRCGRCNAARREAGKLYMRRVRAGQS